MELTAFTTAIIALSIAVVTVIMAYVIAMREWRVKSNSAESASEEVFFHRKRNPESYPCNPFLFVAIANAISAITKPTIARKHPFELLKRYLAAPISKIPYSHP